MIYNLEKLINKIQDHLGNPGDNSSNFSETISDVFTTEIFEFFINSTENNKLNTSNQKDLSEAWDILFVFLG